MERMSTITFGGPIKKYVQTTPSADGVSSLFLIECKSSFWINVFKTQSKILLGDIMH
jgi:hypothetical protein